MEANRSQVGVVEGAMVVLLTLVTLTGAARQLPLQNVIPAGATIAGMALAALLLAPFGFPLGPVSYPEVMGPRLLGIVPWTVPLLFLIKILNSRGVARLIVYGGKPPFGRGWRVLLLAIGLSLLQDGILQTFATGPGAAWKWPADEGSTRWLAAPWSHYFAEAVFTGLSLVAITPWLINKHPGPPRPLSHYPLGVWLSVTFSLAFVSGAHGAVGGQLFGVLTSVVITLLAVRPPPPRRAAR